MPTLITEQHKFSKRDDSAKRLTTILKFKQVRTELKFQQILKCFARL